MWNDLAELRILGLWLQGLAIGLVFVSGILQIAKTVVDRREKTLAGIEQAELEKPGHQIITSGSATVEVVVESSDDTKSHFMDSGGYLVFGQDGAPIMTFNSGDCFGIQNGKNEVVWRAVLSLDAGDPSIGKRLSFLDAAQFIQMGFGPLPPQSVIKKGVAVITINASTRLTLSIPAQKLDGGRIMVLNMNSLKKELEGLPADAGVNK
jgi:hypothetical protein